MGENCSTTYCQGYSLLSLDPLPAEVIEALNFEAVFVIVVMCFLKSEENSMVLDLHLSHPFMNFPYADGLATFNHLPLVTSAGVVKVPGLPDGAGIH